MNKSNIQVGNNETVQAEKNEAVKTVETYLILLLTHNFLAIKPRKFQKPLQGWQTDKKNKAGTTLRISKKILKVENYHTNDY